MSERITVANLDICWPMKTHGISLKNFLQRRNRNGKDAG